MSLLLSFFLCSFSFSQRKVKQVHRKFSQNKAKELTCRIQATASIQKSTRLEKQWSSEPEHQQKHYIGEAEWREVFKTTWADRPPNEGKGWHTEKSHQQTFTLRNTSSCHHWGLHHCLPGFLDLPVSTLQSILLPVAGRVTQETVACLPKTISVLIIMLRN